MSGYGSQIGPDLSQIASKNKKHEIVESLLWPDRIVKPEYVLWRVLTSDGQVVSGYRDDASNDEKIVLRDPSSAKRYEIPFDDVEQEIRGSTLMPAGLTAAMSQRQQIDLVAFLLARHSNELSPEIDRILAKQGQHAPKDFPITTAPISRSQWPNHAAPINKHRIYDFYTKQAEFFRQRDEHPVLMTAFPGLDGGIGGHWGHRDDKDWTDDRWNQTDLGTLQSGVLRGDGRTIPRAICLRLGDQGQLSACFNPATLRYELIWHGGFVKTSPVRHGFVGGLQLDGQVIDRDLDGPKPTTQSTQPKQKHSKFLGLYRVGARVVLEYSIGGVRFLDAPWAVEDRFVREVSPAQQHSMRDRISGGPAQWPQLIEKPVHLGSKGPFAIDSFDMPTDNPWKALVFCSGHDFLSDGSALICTMQGDVWQVRENTSSHRESRSASWKRFASGLHQPLGLLVSDDKVFVQCRDQLMQLVDQNGDGEADYYRCHSDAMITSAGGHDYICGLQRDEAGNFYTASGNQGLLRISPDGSGAEVIATGFRNPDGLGIMPGGILTVPCSEGDWTPASMICAVDSGGATPLHYGHKGPKGDLPPQLPLAYIPRGLDNSSGGQVFVPRGRLGPLSGSLVHFSFGMGSWFLVLQDRVGDVRQGAVVPLVGDFQSGTHRGRINPLDGHLYVSGMHGWVSFTPQDGCFQRIRYTGAAAQVPTGFHAHQNGLIVQFAQPIDRGVAEQLGSHFAQCWDYRYSAAYGSAEFSTTHPGMPGHDRLEITAVHATEDARSLFFEIPEIQPVSQLHLRTHVNRPDQYAATSPAGSGHDLFVTIHQLDQPYTKFPDYRPTNKTIRAHPIQRDMVLNRQRIDNPWEQPIPDARSVEISVGTNLSFAQRTLHAASGEPIKLTLRNPDVVPHNWVLVEPDSLERVGRLSEQLVADPAAFVRHYVPQDDHVLAYTRVIFPGKTGTIYFQAPAKPGRYQFLCTFPGHWAVMNGTMIVEASP